MTTESIGIRGEMMLALIVYILALVFIGVAWGIWALLGVLLGSFVFGLLFKPRYEWDTNWAAIVCGVIVRIIGIFAVNAIWHEPAYDAAAAVIVILSLVF